MTTFISFGLEVNLQAQCPFSLLKMTIETIYIAAKSEIKPSFTPCISHFDHYAELF